MKIKPKVIVVGTAVALGVAGVVAGSAFANSPGMVSATTPAGAVSLTADQHGQPVHLTRSNPSNNGDQAESGEAGNDADSSHEDSG